MNRVDGFPIADVDVALLHDPKVIALARATRDDRTTAARMALYLAVLLASWAAGDRVVVDDAIPAWWLGDVADDRAALVAAGLLDADGRIPVAAWESWYLPAFDRREKKRQGGAEGGRRSWSSRRDKQSRSIASGEPNPTDRPTGRPADRPGRPSRATDSPDGGPSARELMLEYGLSDEIALPQRRIGR